MECTLLCLMENDKYSDGMMKGKAPSHVPPKLGQLNKSMMFMFKGNNVFCMLIDGPAHLNTLQQNRIAL